jgi:S-DNA-T family DNA segregation ATPase FtsK/SpoIIIE
MKFFAGKTSSGKAKPQPRKGGSPEPAPTPISLDTWLDICGIALIGVAALTLFGLLSTQRSALINGWLDLLSRLLGWGVYLAPLIAALLGAYLLIRRFGDRFPRLRPARLSGAILAYLTALATLHGLAIITSAANGTDLAAASQGGGELGWLLLGLLIGLLGNIGAGFAIAAAWIGAAMLVTGVTVSRLSQALQRVLTQPGHDPAASWAARVPGAPTDDIVEPNYKGGLIIRGLKPRRTGRQRPRGAGEEAPTAPSTDLPPARTISDAASRNAPLHTTGAADAGPTPIKINAPASRGQINRVPPPRIIGAPDSSVGQTAASGPVQPAPGTQPAAAAPAIPVSSIYHLRREWKLPNIEDMLEPGSDAAMKEAEIRQRAVLIEDTLRAFGVPSRVVEVNRGPTITQFGVEPGFNELKGGKQVKVKVSRIAALADDLALALAAPRIRIEAPIPGRSLVGIEVPNGETSLVALRDVMESQEFDALQRKTRLRLALGQDVSGRPVVADLTTMPHLLIAGTTGSGKSVCVNAIIVALLCTNSPDDLRFLMIDPKRVELIGYNGIPHLISPVVVDLEKTTAALQWVTREMDSRYRLFARHSARNIVEFNARVAASEGQEPADNELRKLPYIVVVIDELADLMMMAPDETEKVICRLAQMARATGIHLILATQRPSVDVVTGLIKANFPARIAFTVATSVDSRVILDGPGAEKLLGRGDMLVVTPEQSAPMRAQGCYLGPEEIERVVRHWRGQLGDQVAASASPHPATSSAAAPTSGAFVSAGGALHPQQAGAPEASIFGAPPTWEEARALSEAAGEVGASSRDDRLFNEAVATVRLQGKASISLLQRRLRIGYTRAARLIEEMEERGIVGPAVPGQQHREVLNSPLGGTDELS